MHRAPTFYVGTEIEGAIRSLHAPEPKASRDRAALAYGFQESPNRAPTLAC
jgi:hypothetical protein